MPRSCSSVSPATISPACPGCRVSLTTALMPAAAKTGAARLRYTRRPWQEPELGLSTTSRDLHGASTGEQGGVVLQKQP